MQHQSLGFTGPPASFTRARHNPGHVIEFRVVSVPLLHSFLAARNYVQLGELPDEPQLIRWQHRRRRAQRVVIEVGGYPPGSREWDPCLCYAFSHNAPWPSLLPAEVMQ